MECINGKELKVMCSGAGYYIGTSCNMGPYCRVSGYYPDAETATAALEYGFEFRVCEENISCAKGKPCLDNLKVVTITHTSLN